MATEPAGAGAGGPTIDLWITDPGAATAGDRERWLAGWLDDDERARVRAARSESRRTEIVVGRALLRSALGATSGGADPARFRFSTDPGGRPRLVADGQPEHAANLDFSVAHTRGLAVCAIATRGRVGVDAEHRGRRTEALAIARRFFSAGDATAVEAAPPERRVERFLERWTLREAYTKVLGTPLLELERDSVAFELDAPAGARLAAPVSGAGAGRWLFWMLRPTPAHVLALAWRGGGAERAPRVTLRRWPERSLTR